MQITSTTPGYKMALSLLFFILFFDFCKANDSIELNKKLTVFNGKFKLNPGEPPECPDGSFTATESALIVGAMMKIDSINKGVQTEEGIEDPSCKTLSKALFDGKFLKYTIQEICGEKIKRHWIYTLRDQSKGNKRRLEFGAKQIFTSPTKKKSSSSFVCHYSK